MHLSIYPLENAVEITGLTPEQLQSFDQADLDVTIQNSVLYTHLEHLGYVLGWLSDMMTITLD